MEFIYSLFGAIIGIIFSDMNFATPFIILECVLALLLLITSIISKRFNTSLLVLITVLALGFISGNIALNQDNSTFEITNYTLSGNENLITEDTTITISYTDTDTNSTYTTSFIVNAIDITEALADFEYTTNDDGTYTITSWKETLNGEASTEMIVPDNSLIKL